MIPVGDGGRFRSDGRPATLPAAAKTGNEKPEDAQNERAANTRRETDDEGLVVVDPGLDGVAALAVAVSAVAVAVAGCAVEEVLVDRCAGVSA